MSPVFESGENAALTAEAGEALFLSVPIMTERLQTHGCYPAPTLDEQCSSKGTSNVVSRAAGTARLTQMMFLCCKILS